MAIFCDENTADRLYAVAGTEVRIGPYACDRMNVKELYEKIVQKHGPQAAEPPVGAVFRVYLTQNQVMEFLPQGRPYLCPICGHAERIRPTVEGGKTYLCRSCEVEGTVGGIDDREIRTNWNEDTQMKRNQAKYGDRQVITGEHHAPQ